MISLKHKFIFIHAPKTAGNAIQNVLQKYSDDEIINTSFKNGVMDKFGLNNFAGGKHATIRHYIQNWDNSYGRLEDYTISGCVRNPWDRATSYYFYLEKSDMSCDKFETSTKQLLPQTNYYAYEEKNMLYVWDKFENLQADFDRFCDIVKIKEKTVTKSKMFKKNLQSILLNTIMSAKHDVDLLVRKEI